MSQEQPNTLAASPTPLSDSSPSYNDKPNLFIVGAKKAGTTSAHFYLDQHPLIHMSSRKETYYFLDNDEALHGCDIGFHITSEEAYLDLFDTTYPIRGESTPLYLKSKAACRNIHDFNPEAKILILLREPTALLHSLHQQLRLTAAETKHSLGEALRAEGRRRNQDDIPAQTVWPPNLFYSTYVNFADQIQMYAERFGANQVKTILLQDLAQNPQQTYQDILTFLNLPPHQAQFKTHNQRRTIKYPAIHNKVFKAEASIRHHLADYVPYSVSKTMFGILFNLTTEQGEPSRADQALTKTLKQQLKPVVARTHEIVNQDLLAAWDYEEITADPSGPLYTECLNEHRTRNH